MSFCLRLLVTRLSTNPSVYLPCFLLTLIFYGVLPASAEVSLDPEAGYRGKRSEPISYEVDFRAIVTPPHHAETLRVWLPVPPSDNVQQVVSQGFETFPQQVEPVFGTEPKFGNRFAYFEFDHPRGAQIIRHRFRVSTAQLDWDVDPAKVQPVSNWPAEFDRYLQSDRVITVNDEVRQQMQDFLPTARDTLPRYQTLTASFDWLNANLTYDHSNASLQADAMHALTQRRGHCSDYHGLCSAFGRAIGFPTRVTYGMAGFDKNSPSHCKLEAFLPGYGWVSYDLSETQKLIGKINASGDLTDKERQVLTAAARKRLQRGFRDNTWFLQTRGTDYELAPPAARRVNVVRTIYAEADGEALPEPDPSDVTKREFGWMTSHKVTPSRKVSYPFKDWTTLKN